MINANDAKAFPADSFPKVQEQAKEMGFNFPYHGAIDDNYDNPNAVKEAYLRSALDAVLAGQTPKIAQTQPVGCTMKWK